MGRCGEEPGANLRVREFIAPRRVSVTRDSEGEVEFHHVGAIRKNVRNNELPTRDGKEVVVSDSTASTRVGLLACVSQQLG